MLWLLKYQLKSRNVQTRILAVQRLARVDKPEAWQALEFAMNDRETAVRMAALRAIENRSHASARSMLMQGLADQNPEIRQLSAAVLASQPEMDVAPLIVPMLSDPSHEVCWQAAKILESRGWKPTTESETLAHWIACGQFSRAATLGTRAIPQLLSALPRQSAVNRRAIVEIISGIDSEAARQGLIHALKDQDSRVRLAALQGLGRHHDSNITTALEFALQDPAYFVRATAAQLLGDHGARSSFERILPLTGEAHTEVRLAAVEALGKLEDSRAVSALTRSLDDESGEVREAAIKALAALHDTHCLERLIISLLDSRISVRQAAASALGQISPDWEQSTAARKCVPELQRALKSPDYWIRQSAADTLARIARYLDPPKDPKRFGSPDYQREKTVVKILSLTVGDADRDLRLAATEALGRLADADGLEPLIQSMHDPDAWVRQAATRSLNSVINNRTLGSESASDSSQAQSIG
jgi:HEAT repeat protein